VAQVVLPDDREHHLAHRVVRPRRRRLRHPEQQVLLAVDPAELGHQLLGHPPVGAGLDRVDRAQQQRDQGIGDLPAAAVHQRRQQRQGHLDAVLARARGRVGGRRPKLTGEQAALAQQLYDAGEKTVQQIAEVFAVPRSTVYGYLNRAPAGTPA